MAPGEVLAAASVTSARSSWKPEAHFLRGVFAGGTFCYQTQQILNAAGLTVFSNSPIRAGYELADPDHSVDHTVVDMGDEHYTLGKPHPMIDSTERARRIKAEAADPSVAVLLLDFILGRNAASDPVGDLLEVLVEAQSAREQVGSPLTIVASLCGTDEDPQDQAQQAKMLRDIGVHVFGSNAAATKFCVKLLDDRERDAMSEREELLRQPLVVINVGLQSFAESLQEQDVVVVQVDWEPPAGGDQEMIDLLIELL